MACPDELTLDLWRAEALSFDEAATVATHVQTCAACVAADLTAHALDAELHSALALDAEELGYMSSLELASSWRSNPAVTPAMATASSWGWIALAGVIAGFGAWWAAAPMFGAPLAITVLVGLGTLLLQAALDVFFRFGQALFELIRNPAFGLSQPLLALLALALLVWPRQLIPQRSTHS